MNIRYASSIMLRFIPLLRSRTGIIRLIAATPYWRGIKAVRDATVAGNVQSGLAALREFPTTSPLNQAAAHGFVKMCTSRNESVLEVWSMVLQDKLELAPHDVALFVSWCIQQNQVDLAVDISMWMRLFEYTSYEPTKLIEFLAESNKADDAAEVLLFAVEQKITGISPAAFGRTLHALQLAKAYDKAERIWQLANTAGFSEDEGLNTRIVWLFNEAGKYIDAVAAFRRIPTQKQHYSAGAAVCAQLECNQIDEAMNTFRSNVKLMGEKALSAVVVKCAKLGLIHLSNDMLRIAGDLATTPASRRKAFYKLPVATTNDSILYELANSTNSGFTFGPSFCPVWWRARWCYGAASVQRNGGYWRDCHAGASSTSLKRRCN
eukprot:TRINITY_DN128_c0_g7_i1.p1 TRINITY_DN128_c0_g7~~TRINITY_DN128_c0_g7_i1.p1  ORF type:complete len:378 (-),score=56.20 TRINITY_DN128_c0_g7_i1:303-1436(-)